MTTANFKAASEMSYANNEKIQNQYQTLSGKLIEHLKSVKLDKSLFFNEGETVYIPDVHGDFVHLIITLHRYGLLESEVLEPDFHLRKNFKYVFLGDFYDRAPDAGSIDFWLNIQIRQEIEIYRLIGNHEFAFFVRKENGYPVIFPSQDSIKDISNNFQITEDILKNIANGNLIAAYVDEMKTLYIHSYAINDDFTELGLNKEANILDFAITLNKKLQEYGTNAYEIFLECKKKNKYNWKEIIQPFNKDPLFDIEKKRNEINTSFLWRRTGVPILNTYPLELEVQIPDHVYQIVGHTPVFLFKLPRNHIVTYPFVLSVKNSTGKVQFSDVGIGYYYKKDSFERPEITIKKLLN